MPAQRCYDDLSQDQRNAAVRLYEFDYTLLVGKMGAGKTITILTAIAELLDDSEISRVILFTTKTVGLTVWKQEAAQWSHTTHLKINIAIGTERQRFNAITMASDIVVINYENAVWFFDHYKTHNFNAIVFDEIQKVSPSSQILKRARRRLGPFIWRVGATGTPVSEDFLKLFSQMLVLDDGRALGTNFDEYKAEYFRAVDFDRKQWKLRKGSAEKILARIGGNVYTMKDYRDQLPPLVIHKIHVPWNGLTKEVYQKFAKSMTLDTDDEPLIAMNNAVLSQKLHQFTQGFAYQGDDCIWIHDAKLHSMRQLLRVELKERHTIIVYWFKEDLHELLSILPDAVVFDSKQAEYLENAWNSGAIKHLLIHPRSCGHGLNLQRGGHDLVWYSLYWSRDLWEQVIGRLWRRGQLNAVDVWALMAFDGLDPVIMETVEGKGEFDELFMDYFDALTF